MERVQKKKGRKEGKGGRGRNGIREKGEQCDDMGERPREKRVERRREERRRDEKGKGR